FVHWDDRTNFLENRALDLPGWSYFRWAWRATVLGVYQPLSWLLIGGQHAAWGLTPSGYHALSLALHAACVAAVFALARSVLRLARPEVARDRPADLDLAAAIAAALFGVHPLRAEAV